MAKVLVLYHSIHGHVEAMAEAIAEGARGVRGTEVTVKRVPETMPEDALRALKARLDQPAPVATVDELADYDAIIFGTPTRFGNMSGQMRTFLDQTGKLWAAGALVGKVGSVFVSTATQHGGQETTITSFHTTLLHQGMVVVGLPYSFQGQTRLDVITGGSPYGAGTISGGGGERMPSRNELDAARFQGRHVAEVTARLVAGAGVVG